MVEGDVVLEVLLGEEVEGGVVGLELLDAVFRCFEVEVGGGDDGGDDEDAADECEETHVEILCKKIRFFVYFMVQSELNIYHHRWQHTPQHPYIHQKQPPPDNGSRHINNSVAQSDSNYATSRWWR
jgi:hypothetical protein